MHHCLKKQQRPDPSKRSKTGQRAHDGGAERSKGIRGPAHGCPRAAHPSVPVAIVELVYPTASTCMAAPPEGLAARVVAVEAGCLPVASDPLHPRHAPSTRPCQTGRALCGLGGFGWSPARSGPQLAIVPTSQHAWRERREARVHEYGCTGCRILPVYKLPVAGVFPAAAA